MVRMAVMKRTLLRIACALPLVAPVACGGNDSNGNDNGTANGGAALACSWDAPRLQAPAPDPIPSGQAGDLAEVLPGAWQHTHVITDGGTPDPLTDLTDIRFVISGERLLYCQDTEFTGQDENATSYELQGADIVFPRGAGYTAVAWTADVMVWNNNTIPGEQFVLQRR